MNVKDRRSGTALFAVAIAVTAWGFGPLLVNGISTSPMRLPVKTSSR